MKIESSVRDVTHLGLINVGEAFYAAENVLYLRLALSDQLNDLPDSGIPVVNLSNGCFSFSAAHLEVSLAAVKIVSE